MSRWLVIAIVAGCSAGPHVTDIQPSLRLADRSDAEIERLIRAAFGGDASNAYTAFGSLVGTSDPCPTVTFDDDTTTIHGGCTTIAGVTIDGIATQTEKGFDFDHLTIAQQFYDGSVAVDGDHIIAADLVVDRDGISVRSDLANDYTTLPGCDNECAISVGPVGSGLELTAVVACSCPGPGSIGIPATHFDSITSR